MATHTAGVKNIQLPIRVMQKDGGVQDTVASVSLHTRIGLFLETKQHFFIHLDSQPLYQQDQCYRFLSAPQRRESNFSMPKVHELK